MATVEKHEEKRKLPPDAQAEKERRSKAKAAVRAANDELHAMRPQPRADQIENILDRIRSADDPSSVKAKDLLPKEETKAA